MTVTEDVGGKVLYEDTDHKFVWLSWSEDDEGGLVQTNQYLIISGGVGVLLDPGGAHVFPKVVAATARYISLEKIKYIFYSHQDPDVSSGLHLWMSVTDAEVYISKLWLRFVPHFGSVNLKRIIPVDDRGGRIVLPDAKELHLIPAHYLHSTGNFTLYDPTAKILFSGDIGAAVFPKGKNYLFVEDFENHIPFMEGFHRRYMKSQRVLRKWVGLVRQREVDLIAPQHGAVFPKSNVEKFLNWLENLRCGEDILDEIYGV
ncbi:oxygen-binding di-iron domain-containing protein [Hydrogenivirga sp.]